MTPEQDRIKRKVQEDADDEYARKNEPRARRYGLQVPAGNIFGMGTEKPKLSRKDKRNGWRVIPLGTR